VVGQKFIDLIALPQRQSEFAYNLSRCTIQIFDKLLIATGIRAFSRNQLLGARGLCVDCNFATLALFRAHHRNRVHARGTQGWQERTQQGHQQAERGGRYERGRISGSHAGEQRFHRASGTVG
jgi:hypothetical protein